MVSSQSRILDAFPRAGAFAGAGFVAIVVAQIAYTAYSGGQMTTASFVGAMRGAVVFAFVDALGALAGFGALPRQGASLARAALLGALGAVPIALLAAYSAGSVGMLGAAGFVIVAAAVIAYVGGGGMHATQQ